MLKPTNQKSNPTLTYWYQYVGSLLPQSPPTATGRSISLGSIRRCRCVTARRRHRDCGTRISGRAVYAFRTWAWAPGQSSRRASVMIRPRPYSNWPLTAASIYSTSPRRIRRQRLGKYYSGPAGSVPLTWSPQRSIGAPSELSASSIDWLDSPNNDSSNYL